MVLSDFTICHTTFLIGDNDKELNMYRFPVKGDVSNFQCYEELSVQLHMSEVYSETDIIVRLT